MSAYTSLLPLMMVEKKPGVVEEENLGETPGESLGKNDGKMTGEEGLDGACNREPDKELVEPGASDEMAAKENKDKKKKKQDAAAGQSGPPSQTDPPSVPLRALYPEGRYPVGETHSYGQQ